MIESATAGHGETPTAVWTGSWVSSTLGLRVWTARSGSIVPVEALVGIALRRNPRRAHLLVSTVLAKHVPTEPAVALAAAALLGSVVARRLEAGSIDRRASDMGEPGDAGRRLTALGSRLALLLDIGVVDDNHDDIDANDRRAELAAIRTELSDGRKEHPGVVVLGYAETATGLGRIVADHLGAYYIHSTRRPGFGVPAFAGFEEEHSHATSHRLHPLDGAWLTLGGTVVLVDDELSTGRTVVNTIRALQSVVPQARWCVASLIDLRGPSDRAVFGALAAEMGCQIDVVSLGTGSVSLPDAVVHRAEGHVRRAELAQREARAQAGTRPVDEDGDDLVIIDLSGVVPPTHQDAFGSEAHSRDDLSATAASGFTSAVVEALLRQHPELADDAEADGLIVGCEEFIAVPLAVAAELDGRTPGRVRFSTTTRSPIAVIDEPGYAIRSAVAFATDDESEASGDSSARFAYNVTSAQSRPSRILVFPEPGSDAASLSRPGGLVEALVSTGSPVTLVILPAADPLHAPTLPPTSDEDHRA